MKAVLLAIASGLLFAAALPPQNWEWLGWIAFVPLLLAAIGRRPLEAVGLGLLAGGVCGALHCGWNRDTDRLFWAYIPFLWLTLLFGLAALAGAWARRSLNGLPWALFVACVATIGEWLTTWLPMPLNVALAEWQNLPLIQIASLSGIWGVSFVLWLVNAAVADALLQRRLSAAVAWAAALTALSFGFGALALHGEARGPRLRVAAIQDFTGDETGDLAPAPVPNAPDVDREAMTRQAAADGASLVVWSEECLGSAFAPDDPRDGARSPPRAARGHAPLPRRGKPCCVCPLGLERPLADHRA